MNGLGVVAKGITVLTSVIDYKLRYSVEEGF